MAWGPLGRRLRPQQVPGHHSGDPVAQLLLVDEDPLPADQPAVQVAVEVGEGGPGRRPRWAGGSARWPCDFSS